jgi:hypothetical protein
MSRLSAELDLEGRTPWWPPVSGFLKRHSGIRTMGNTAAGGAESAPKPADDGAVVEDFKLMVVEVLGGQIPMLQEGAAVSLQDGRSGLIVHCGPSVLGRGNAGTDAPVFSTRAAYDTERQKAGAADGSNTGKVWIALSDGSLCQCDSASLCLESPFRGRLGPESLSLLLPYIRPVKEHLFKVEAPSPSTPVVANTNSNSLLYANPRIYLRLLKVTV